MNIIKHPSRILSTVCTPFLDVEIEAHRFADPSAEGMLNIYQLGKDMLRTMRDAHGIGLAAPQVGITRRLIVGYVSGYQFVLANPEVVPGSAKGTGGQREGCLSYPGKQVYIERPKLVRITGWDFSDVHSEPVSIEIKARNMLARVLLHEMDHLDGVCKVGPKKNGEALPA